MRPTRLDLWKGFPGYPVDGPVADSRALPWLLYEYKATGELYYDTTESTVQPLNGNPITSSSWNSDYFSGGETATARSSTRVSPPGTTLPILLRWTTPLLIGGSDPIPIESLRLKRIRDGRQDYELLHMLDSLGDPTDAESIAETLLGPPGNGAPSTGDAMHNVFDTTMTAAKVATAGDQLASDILSSLASASRRTSR